MTLIASRAVRAVSQREAQTRIDALSVMVFSSLPTAFSMVGERSVVRSALHRSRAAFCQHTAGAGSTLWAALKTPRVYGTFRAVSHLADPLSGRALASIEA